MKKLKIALAVTFLLAFCAAAWAEQPVVDRRQYRKNLAYNKNAFPMGWQHEVGYTAWRMNRNLPVNFNTYRKYRNDKAWQNRMNRYHRPEKFLLDTLDWTTEEIALFLHENQDYFKFHPSGYVD